MWNSLRRLALNTYGRSTLSQHQERCLKIQSGFISSASLKTGPSLYQFTTKSFLQPWTTTTILSSSPYGSLMTFMGPASGLGSSMTSPTTADGYLVPTRGMKIKGKVKRRCKDCYLIWIDGILHNLCKTMPRHKQMLKPAYWANMRILTHATSHFKRPW